MTVNAALSPFASDASSAENARSGSLPSGAPVASRELRDFAVVSAPDAVAPSGPNDATPENAPSPSARADAPVASAPSPNKKIDYVDDAGEIDWNAALNDNERWLRSTIATQVGESAAVDEVFQDVALAATRQQAPIRDPRKIAAWLRRLATVYSLLYRRSLGRKKKLLRRYQERVPVADAAPADADPLRWLLLEERRALVQEATALLPDDERRVLTLKYSEDKSYKEIADELGATVSAVQSKLHRARARLREKLAALAPNAVAPPT